MTVQVLVFLGTLSMAAASLVGGVWVAKIGGRSTQQARTTPAYTDLLEEIKGYREEAKADRAQVEKVERDLDDERRMRRDLEGHVRDQSHELQGLRRDLEEERQHRERLQSRVQNLEGTLGHAEDYIRRSWERVRRDFPHAWSAFLPIPEWMTDPGIPVVRHDPPDDGQPEDVS